MKAAVFQALGEPLIVADVSDPRPKRDEVVLKICRCGICGSDLHMTVEPGFGAAAGDVLGHEISGEVIEAGSEAGFKLGDQVSVAPLRGCGHCAACRGGEPARCVSMQLIGGGYAQYAAIAGRQCRKLPIGVSAADGALAEPLAVALHGVQRSGMKPGDRVLVVGAGAIGLAIAFWARRLGAGEVIMADLHQLQEERAMTLGATAFFLSDDGLDRRLQERCPGGPDIVFECVGKPGLIDFCVSLVRPRGTVAVLGLCTSPDHMDSFRAISKEVNILMSVFFDMREFVRSIDALEKGQYSPQSLISETVGLEATPTMFEALRRRTTQCKVLIDPFAPALCADS
jgi:(R,R)-butanediol dehydrogenase/meso-butanediol dehydrogenase/diacetyl reductase